MKYEQPRYPNGVIPGAIPGCGLNTGFKCKRCRRKDLPTKGRKARIINGKKDGFICEECANDQTRA